MSRTKTGSQPRHKVKSDFKAARRCRRGRRRRAVWFVVVSHPSPDSPDGALSSALSSSSVVLSCTHSSSLSRSCFPFLSPGSELSAQMREEGVCVAMFTKREAACVCVCFDCVHLRAGGARTPGPSAGTAGGV